MKELDRHYYVNIREIIRVEDDNLRNIIASFSCAKNADVENFFKANAIEFTKKNQSVTYLVFSKEHGLLAGYFTLAVKPLTISVSDITSNTQRKKIERICRLDEASRTYTMSAYLIAQLGRNFADGAERLISGDYLLEIALKVIRDLQYMAGGMVSFVETENNAKLLNFYQRNKFHLISTPRNELIQLYRII